MNNHIIENKKLTGITFYKPLDKMIPSEVYDSYWEFAALRQNVFFNRWEGKPFPWTDDPIIAKYKFTNAYRASDRVSQYLIKEVIYNKELPSEQIEVLFRILLFKLFNKIETWELLKADLGIISYKDFKFTKYNELLQKVICSKVAIYSGAYIMPSGKSFFGSDRKHSNHLMLISYMLQNNLLDKLSNSNAMQDAFEVLKAFPTIGDFLAYQLLIDINYSPILNFSESEFVVPGPGAKAGISKCFINNAGRSDSEIIKMMYENQNAEFERLGLKFKNLWGRELQLIDCQNLFCEVDKYARIKHPAIKGKSNRVRIKQLYKPKLISVNYWFPEKWGINENIGTAN